MGGNVTGNASDFESDEQINREINEQLHKPEKKKSGTTSQAQRRQDEAVARQDKSKGIPEESQRMIDRLLGREGGGHVV